MSHEIPPPMQGVMGMLELGSEKAGFIPELSG
jgi:hypothetical protein